MDLNSSLRQYLSSPWRTDAWQAIYSAKLTVSCESNQCLSSKSNFDQYISDGVPIHIISMSYFIIYFYRTIDDYKKNEEDWVSKEESLNKELENL